MIWAASWLVPRMMRGRWRRAWISEIWHYNTLLRDGGMKNRHVASRLWHHSRGALRDAWRLRRDMPGTRKLGVLLHKPSFSLGVIAFFLAGIVAGSHGLAITRAMLYPGYPSADRLVLICETGGVFGERHPVAPALVEFWKAHATTLAAMAGYQWDSHGTARVTPEFFNVLGARPRRFLLRPIRQWKPVSQPHSLAVLGRLKPGITPEAAQNELTRLEASYWHDQQPSAFETVQVTPLVARIRHPLYSYDLICGLTTVLLLAVAMIGMRAGRRRSGRIRFRYWAYFCAKAIFLPLALTLIIWEFSRATTLSLTGSPAFRSEPWFAWLVILGCGAIAWWCLWDQRVRCRACVETLRYPVRIGSLGAVLFNHAGMELVCCEGHGALYLPAMSSDYVQGRGWTALDTADISSEPAPR
jgi:hypothetical protein